MSLKLMYITNNLDVALIAQKCGVDRVWVDLETIGKDERQMGIDAVKSHHTIEDIQKIKPHLTTSEMLVRINHWHDGSVDEIESVIDAGADMIMLPYWKSVDEVRKFLTVVNNRCTTTLLLETKEAVEIIDDVLKMGGFDEIHIGLNDLHLSYGMTFMFELLSNGTVKMLCEKFKNAGLSYGFGGIAKLGDGLLTAEKVIMEHYWMGSTRAILSRSFCDSTKFDSIEELDQVFERNMKSLRAYERSMLYMTERDYTQNHEDVIKTVEEIVKKRKDVKR